MIRIEQLDLIFFGHFTNKQFDFGKRPAKAPDFHIIYGANEAGKSTFMNAYLRLLYGFLPKAEPYAFRHGRTNLHVSAQLQVDEQLRTFQRKGTGRNSLLDAQGNVLSEASLRAQLGGLSMEDYKKLYCIDDQSIEDGGKEIVNSRGNVGAMLFSATSGVNDLWQVLDSVNNKAEDLYKHRGTKTRVALLKKEHADVVKRIKQLDIPAVKLGQYTKALKQAQLKEEETLKQRTTLIADERRLSRLLNALPVLEQVDIAKEAALRVGHYPENLTLSFKQIVDLQKEEADAASDQRRLQGTHESLTQQLQQLPATPAFVGLDEAMEGLDDLHGRYRRAELELEGQTQELEEVSSRMNRLVQEQLKLDTDAVALVLETSVITSLKNALSQMNQAQVQVTNLTVSIDESSTRLKVEESKLEDLQKADVDGHGLDVLLESYNAQALSGEHKAAVSAIAESQERVDEALGRLTIQGQRFSQLPACVLVLEDVETQVDRWHELASTLQALNEKQTADKQELLALTEESKQLSSTGELASDEETQDLTALRDKSWQQHKQQLTEQSAQAFELTMFAVDKAMQGRLHRASDLARLRELNRQIPKLQVLFETNEDSIRLALEERNDIEASLAQAMRGSGIENSMSPKAVLAWLRHHKDAQAIVFADERLRENKKPILLKAQKLHDELSTYIKREQASLEELLSAANAMLQVYSGHAEAIKTSKKALAEKREERDAVVAQCETAKEKLTEASQQWESLIEASLPVPLDPEVLATSIDVLTELRECNVQRESLHKQCTQMQRDAALFVDKLAQLASDFKLEQADTPDSSRRKFKTLAEEAKKQADERAALEKTIKKTASELVEAQKRLDEVKVQSQIFAGLFDARVPVADLNQLFKAVEETEQAQRLRGSFAEKVAALTQALGVASEEKARALLVDIDAASVEAELIEKTSALDSINETIKEATEQRTRCEEQLRALTGDGEVAQLVERRTTLELQMSEAALEYLKLKLGMRLAGKAISRYRDQHRSEMLQVTETVFAELTSGKYASLQTQSNGKEETLLAVDADGTAKRADEMSKGTCFQLYLALRAAAYEHLADQGTCLPFICDDIFETFDENRTRAACKLMERVGRRGQAIYLTHHNHVVELAREVCGNRVRVHHL